MKPKISAIILTCCLIISVREADSQIYSASKCERHGNPALADMLHSGKIDKLSWMGKWHLGLYVCDWCTSFLPASGRGPKPLPANLEDLPDWETMASDHEMELEKWHGMYSPWSAMDSDSKTAWCEGRKDNGTGEVLLVKADTSKPVRIWAGLGASADLHRKNSRPEKVKVYVLQASKAYVNIGQYADGIEYQDIKVLASGEVILKDLNGYQPLPLPKHSRSSSVINTSSYGAPPVKIEDTTFVALEILSVYPGTKYSDTCISEAGN